MSYKNVIAILGLSVLGFVSTLAWAQQPGSAPKDKSGAAGSRDDGRADALMDQMHSKMMGQENMMHDMEGQMKNCSGMGGASKR